MLYWDLLREKSTVDIALRKRIALHALRHGVSDAARAYGTTRTTARKWRERYQAEGVRGLADRCRAPKHIPHKTSERTADRVIALRQRYPGWGPDRLATHFRLGCSRSAAARILRQEGLTKRRKKKRVRNDLRAQKARLRPFEKLQADTKELRDIPAYLAYMQDQALPRYVYSLRELRTGNAWFAYAHHNDTWHAHLFADYVLGHLAACGVDLSETTVQSDNGSEYIGSARKVRGEPTLFEQTVEYYTGRPPVTIFPGAKTSQSDVEAFHRLVEDEFLAVEDHSSRERLLGRSRIYQVYFNHYRRLLWKGGNTPVDFFRDAQDEGHQPAATPEAFTLPPILLDDLEPLLHTPGYDVPVMVRSRPARP